MTSAYMNWSGGKDSSLCLYYALQSGQYKVPALLTSVNAAHNRISMHGVRRELLEVQATELGIPLHSIELPEQPDMETYEQHMQQAVTAMIAKGCTHTLFGDIFLEDLRRYREEQLKPLGITAIFPLWKRNTRELLEEFIAFGFQAIIVCLNEAYLDKSFCGRLIDASFLADLPANVDPCGENGEYHSFVFDGPIFRQPIPFTKGEIVYRTYPAPTASDGNTANPYGFYFCDLLPV